MTTLLYATAPLRDDSHSDHISLQEPQFGRSALLPGHRSGLDRAETIPAASGRDRLYVQRHPVFAGCSSPAGDAWRGSQLFPSASSRIDLSGDKSATCLFRRAFSRSKSFNRRTCLGAIPPHTLRHRQYVCSVTPICLAACFAGWPQLSRISTSRKLWTTASRDIRHRGIVTTSMLA
jgi:hypothetical protein